VDVDTAGGVTGIKLTPLSLQERVQMGENVDKIFIRSPRSISSLCYNSVIPF